MKKVTDLTATQFTQEVGQKQHAMAGAVIALSSAQAVALGLACMRISRDDQKLMNTKQPIDRMEQIRVALLDLSDRDAGAIAKYVALRDAGKALAGQRLLCSAPSDSSRLSIEASQILQRFRPAVSERVRDDLEMSISLLAGTAQAALLLLDSNLRIWENEDDLLAEFEPLLETLAAEIGNLTPRKRIREI